MSLGPAVIAFPRVITSPLLPAIEGYSIYLQKTDLGEDTAPLVEVLGQLVITSILTSLDANSLYLLGIRARTADGNRSDLITNHVLKTDGSGNPVALPGAPKLLDALNLASAGLRIFWEYTDHVQVTPESFSIRLNGVEVSTLTYSATKGKYELDLVGLSSTSQLLTVVAIRTVNSIVYERSSNKLSVFPSSNIPIAPNNLVLRQI